MTADGGLLQGQQRPGGGAVGADLSTEALESRLPDVRTVEVLGPDVFASGHIPGAVNIPPHRVRELAPALLPRKDASLVVYGARGDLRAVLVVARRLAELGYRSVSCYPEGKQAWAEAGLPLVHDGGL
jgi:rhodanese-related sulfurtransferase